jgi:hypothetical protein
MIKAPLLKENLWELSYQHSIVKQVLAPIFPFSQVIEKSSQEEQTNLPHPG